MRISNFNQALKSSFLLSLLFLTTLAMSQKSVSASDILNDIKNGKNISYENATITGTLDLTYMDDKIADLPKRNKWYKKGGDNTVKENIDVKLSFKNCTFKDGVYAYIHEEDSGYTFIANFENDVIFKDCTFNGAALFKYSSFERQANFNGSVFKDQTTFKYAKFENKVNFANTVFDENAIFKYTKFKEGVAFNNAKFNENLDLKYTKVDGDFEIDKLFVNGEINSKYTNINGNSFSKQLLKNNN